MLEKIMFVKILLFNSYKPINPIQKISIAMTDIEVEK